MFKVALPSGVLSQCSIIVVDDTGLWVEDNVLQDGSESDSIEDIRFLLSRQTNALGVALDPLSVTFD